MEYRGADWHAFGRTPWAASGNNVDRAANIIFDAVLHLMGYCLIIVASMHRIAMIQHRTPRRRQRPVVDGTYVSGAQHLHCHKFSHSDPLPFLSRLSCILMSLIACSVLLVVAPWVTCSATAPSLSDNHGHVEDSKNVTWYRIFVKHHQKLVTISSSQ